MLNQILVKEDFSSFVQVIDAEYTFSEAISVLLSKKVINSMLLLFHSDLLLTAIRYADSEIFSVKALEQ